MGAGGRRAGGSTGCWMPYWGDCGLICKAPSLVWMNSVTIHSHPWEVSTRDQPEQRRPSRSPGYQWSDPVSWGVTLCAWPPRGLSRTPLWPGNSSLKSRMRDMQMDAILATSPIQFAPGEARFYRMRLFDSTEIPSLRRFQTFNFVYRGGNDSTIPLRN